MLPSRRGHASDTTFMSTLHVVDTRRPEQLCLMKLWASAQNVWIHEREATEKYTEGGLLRRKVSMVRGFSTRSTLILKACLETGDTISPKAAQPSMTDT